MRRVIAPLIIFGLIATTGAYAVEAASVTSTSAMLQRTNNDQETTDFDSNAWEQATPIASSYNSFELGNKLAFGMEADEEGEVEVVSAEAASDATDVEKLNPGRALMLSAIIPGAGELYAGSKIKAAVFFAAEIALWYGAISYANSGHNQEDDFETFADNNWDRNYYDSVEMAAAQAGTGDSSFDGDTEEWDGMDWNDKINYLPQNFTHELPKEENQQYYENVGKYMTQFGWGWLDWINNRDVNTITALAQTANFNWKEVPDARSAAAEAYVNMRKDANDDLDLSANFFSLIMVNHVVSALDAGFTVRSRNRKLAEVTPQASMIMHNSRPVNVAGIGIRF